MSKRHIPLARRLIPKGEREQRKEENQRKTRANSQRLDDIERRVEKYDEEEKIVIEWKKSIKQRKSITFHVYVLMWNSSDFEARGKKKSRSIINSMKRNGTVAQ